MPTPFQMHMQKVREQQAREEQKKAMEERRPAAIENSVKDYGEFELLKMSLESDVRASKDVPRGAARDELRDKTLLPRYLPHVQAYMASDEEYANPILVQVMLWLFDAGRLEQALPVAELAIKQGQQMPADFKRDVPTFVADAVLEWAEGEYKGGRAIEPYFSRVFSQLEQWTLPDVVLMKFNKFAGKVAFDSDNFALAAQLLESADQLSTSSNPAQVSTLLAKAKKKAGVE